MSCFECRLLGITEVAGITGGPSQRSQSREYRSMSKNVVYFGKPEARAREAKAANTEV